MNGSEKWLQAISLIAIVVLSIITIDLLNEKDEDSEIVYVVIDNRITIDEDYTIGKVIEYVLYQKHFENDKILSYVGFCKFHPHDTSSYIRIAFMNETNANKVNICNIVKASCNDAINLVYKNIMTSFK